MEYGLQVREDDELEGEELLQEGRAKGGDPIRKGPLLEAILHDAGRKIVRTACENVLPGGGASVLEVLAGPESLLPDWDPPAVVTGVGGHGDELEANAALSRRIVLDLNTEAELPFEDNAFDAAVLLFGVETLDRPKEVFREVSRVVKTNGTFLIAYASVSDREHAIPRWHTMDEQERLGYVVGALDAAGSFGPATAYGTKKRYRSEASRKVRPAREQAHVWVVYARTRPAVIRNREDWGTLVGKHDASEDPTRCVYCGEKLKKYEVPLSPFEIDYWYESDYLYICFNDSCPYFERGWEWMWSQMKRNVSYRYMYNPATKKSGPIPVPTYFALKDGIVEDDA